MDLSQIRCAAQIELFCLLKCYRFSYQVIVDRIVELFNKPDTVDHDQIKVCPFSLLFSFRFTETSSRDVFTFFWVKILIFCLRNIHGQ
jgi:hypothetical protein